MLGSASKPFDDELHEPVEARTDKQHVSDYQHTIALTACSVVIEGRADGPASSMRLRLLQVCHRLRLRYQQWNPRVMQDEDQW